MRHQYGCRAARVIAANGAARLPDWSGGAAIPSAKLASWPDRDRASRVHENIYAISPVYQIELGGTFHGDCRY